MSDLRIVLVEDEPVTARNLAYVLQNVDSNIRIVTMLKSISESVIWFSTHQSEYDLVFMDIRLSDGLSFDILKRTAIDRAIIFVTAYHDYAIEAFKNNGIDYILKPFDEKEVERALHKFHKLVAPLSRPTDPSRLNGLLEQFGALVRSYKRSFLVSYRNKLVPLQAVRIAWFHTANEIVYANTVEGQQYTMEFTLEQLEGQLDPQVFFRANRQFIINRAVVIEMEFFFNGRLLVKLNPSPAENVLISKARVPDFKNWMGN